MKRVDDYIDPVDTLDFQSSPKRLRYCAKREPGPENSESPPAAKLFRPSTETTKRAVDVDADTEARMPPLKRGACEESIHTPTKRTACSEPATVARKRVHEDSQTYDDFLWWRTPLWDAN